jgi:hypothetical protein
MKTIKLYKLLLLLPFFLSLSCLASDSLKVKKTEYYDNNILVRELFFDTLGKKTKDISYNFQDMYNDNLSNEVLIIKYKNEKHFSFTTYLCKVKSDSVYFYNPTFIGHEQEIIYDLTGKFIESKNTIFTLKRDNPQRNFALKSLEVFLPKDEQDGNLVKYNYDIKGNQISRLAFTNNKIIHETYYKYDTLNRLIEDRDVAKPFRSFTQIVYQGNNRTINTIKKEGLSVLEKKIEKVFENESKQEIRKEKYLFPLKYFRVIGEPKLTFTKESIYENDRVVKIIYTDHILNKTKTHELKYEFY